MATFRYVAKTRGGERKEGTLEAPDKRAAMAMLSGGSRASISGFILNCISRTSIASSYTFSECCSSPPG